LRIGNQTGGVVVLTPSLSEKMRGLLMLRTLLLIVALLILIGIALVAFGAINLRQGSDGTVQIETKDVEVGTTEANVQLPVVRMENRTVEVPSVGVEDDVAKNESR
jgi:cytoskeletal protein RodZ